MNVFQFINVGITSTINYRRGPLLCSIFNSKIMILTRYYVILDSLPKNESIGSLRSKVEMWILVLLVTVLLAAIIVPSSGKNRLSIVALGIVPPIPIVVILSPISVIELLRVLSLLGILLPILVLVRLVHIVRPLVTVLPPILGISIVLTILGCILSLILSLPPLRVVLALRIGLTLAIVLVWILGIVLAILLSDDQRKEGYEEKKIRRHSAKERLLKFLIVINNSMQNLDDNITTGWGSNPFLTSWSYVG